MIFMLLKLDLEIHKNVATRILRNILLNNNNKYLNEWDGDSWIDLWFIED